MNFRGFYPISSGFLTRQRPHIPDRATPWKYSSYLVEHAMLKELKFESQTTYTFLEEIGQGGMGIVYLAERNSGGVSDYVVLKTLKSLNKDDEKALRQEANLAALLRHENIVKTYGLESIALSALPRNFIERLGGLSYLQEQEKVQIKLRRLQFKQSRVSAEQLAKLEKKAVEEKDLLLIVMDYVDGINLRSLHFEHVCQGVLMPVPFSAFIISRVARSLAYAHNYLIHRDVSPENILISTQGICKLSDFGIAVATRKQPDYWAGKLSYMAPEQIFNQPIDERVDIFSLGSVAYQLATGIPLVQLDPKAPFEEQVQSVKQQLAKGILPPAKVRYDVSVEFSDIIMKMVAPSPYMRYQRASEVANDLEKKFLYAKGYGPTNNSLSTYLTIFENKFAGYNEEHLEQMSFLKNEQGEIEIKRPLEQEQYTPEGLGLMEERQNSEVYKRLKVTKHIRQIQALRKESRVAQLKVKYLDNVIEAFPVGDRFTIGSSPDMDLSLDDPSISRHHCTLTSSGENVVLDAAGPDARLAVNKKLVTHQEIRNGDKIKIGSFMLFFIKQRELGWKDTYNISLDKDVDLQSIVEKVQDFVVILTPNPESLTRLARLVDGLLSKTDLSELKLGIIPTAILESVQIFRQGKEGQTLEIRIVKTSVRLMFSCLNLTEQGYQSFLNNFQKHRQRLAEEVSQKETTADEAEPTGVWAEELFQDGTQPLRQQVKSSPESEEVDIDAMDFADIDPSMLAATVIVHAFDRIEFQRDKRQVDLVVYL